MIGLDEASQRSRALTEATSRPAEPARSKSGSSRRTSPQRSKFITTWIRLETLALLCALALCAFSVLTYQSTRASVLTVAVAPRDGTEPALFKAFVDALERRKARVRLKLVSYDDVDGSARALASGAADLAVVRPDVVQPPNGLSIAVLRDQAMLIASPADRRITRFSALSGRRLGIVAHANADANLLRDIAAFYGLRLTWDTGAPATPGQLLLRPLRPADLETAFRSHQIDAAVLVVAPSAPRALAFIDAVRSATATRHVGLVGFDQIDALVERFPKLQEIDLPASLLEGDPLFPRTTLRRSGRRTA